MFSSPASRRPPCEEDDSESSQTIVKLHYRSYGEGPALIVLHGLLGASGNWHSLARSALGAESRVITVDLRNHGRSPHSEDFSYDAMAADVLELMDDLGLDSARLLGHSMGGKTAMHFALLHETRVDALVVVDIAPVDYPHLHRETLDALRALDPGAYTSRKQIDDALAAEIPDPSVRQLLLKGVRREKSGFRWTFNLDAIHAGYSSLQEAVLGWQPFEGPVLFVRGSESDYIMDENLTSIRTLFPYAEIETIDGTGHWVHADRPDAFARLVTGFLRRV